MIELKVHNCEVEEPNELVLDVDGYQVQTLAVVTCGRIVGRGVPSSSPDAMTAAYRSTTTP